MENIIPEDAKTGKPQIQDDVPNIAEIESRTKTDQKETGPGFLIPRSIQEGDVETGIDAVGEGLAESSGALVAPPLILGAAAAGFGLKGIAAGIKAAKTIKSSPFSKNISDLTTAAKQKISSAGESISNVFKKTPGEETAKPAESVLEKIGNVFRTKKEPTSKEKFDEFFKPEGTFKPKLGKVPKRTGNINKINRNPFRTPKLSNSIPLIGPAMETLFGGETENVSRVSNAGNISAVQNSAAAALMSMPSGGDTGTVGESHFGGGGLNGMTILEALSKIYALLIQSNDSLNAIESNTAKMLRQTAKMDTASDLAGANAAARINEAGGQSYSTIIGSGSSSNYEEPGISGNISEKPDKPLSSSLWSKVVNTAKIAGTGAKIAGKIGLTALGLGAIGASEAKSGENNIMDSSAKLMSAIKQDNMYDRIKSIIKVGESNNNYSVIYGGGKPDKELTQMTIREVIDYQTKMLQHKDNSGKAHSPVGAYQIVRDTLKENYELAGLTLDDKFTPENQDKIADILIAKRMQRSDGSNEGFARQLALEWASLGDPTQQSGASKPINSDIVMAAITGVEDDEEKLETPTVIKQQQNYTLSPTVENAKKLKESSTNSVSKVTNNTTNNIEKLNSSSKDYTNISRINDINETLINNSLNLSNAQSATPIIDSPETHESLKVSALEAQSIVSENPQNQIASQTMNDGFNKVAQLIASNQQPQQVSQPIIMQQQKDSAGTGGGMMSVRNDDPVLLTLTYGNVKTA